MTSLSITKSTVGTGQLTKIQRAYSSLAFAYDRLRPLRTGGALGHTEHFLEREVIPQYCPSGAAVLDLGCGTGANLERILRTGIPVSRYVGVGRAENAEAASRLTQRMVDSINESGSAFNNLQRQTVADHQLFQVDGSGGRHFFYNSQKQREAVVWLTIEADDPLPILKEAVKIF